MALPTTFETQDAFHAAIPEGFREHYKEKDGKYFLEVDKPEVVATGLAKNRDDLLKEKKALADKIAAYDSKFKGKSLEEIEAMLAAAEKQENEKLKSENNLDAVLEKWKREKQQLEDKHSSEIQALTNQLNKFKIDDKLRTAALDGGVIKEIVGDVVNLIRQRVQLTEGDQLVLLDENGSPLSVGVERFFSDVFKNERPHYYEASGAGGSGATGGVKKLTRQPDYSKLPAAEKIKMARQLSSKGA